MRLFKVAVSFHAIVDVLVHAEDENDAETIAAGEIDASDYVAELGVQAKVIGQPLGPGDPLPGWWDAGRHPLGSGLPASDVLEAAIAEQAELETTPGTDEYRAALERHGQRALE